MSDNLVCPDCGHDVFTQRRYCHAAATVTVDSGGYIEDQAIEIDDHGDPDEGELTCNDCGTGYIPDELITYEAYEADV